MTHRAALRRLAVAAGSGGRQAIRARYAPAAPAAEAAAAGTASLHSGPAGTRNAPEATDAGSASAPKTIPFPREGPGVNYALNWSLAAAGVTPRGAVHRNVGVAKLGAGVPAAPKSPPKVLLQGSKDLPRGAFAKLIKEVTAHLSSLPSVLVHDGAVGASSASDARTRAICDSPAAAAAAAALLCPTPTRNLASASFPLTLYLAQNFKSESLGESLIAVDFATSSVIAVGAAAVADAPSLKSVLAALAAPAIISKAALPLDARYVSKSGTSALLLSPPSIPHVLPKFAVFPDDAVAWSAGGVSPLFPVKDSSAPNLHPSPSAVVLLTSDSTKVLPPALKLTPPQFAYYFLAGYSGATFHPACAHPPTAGKSAAAAAAALAGAGASPLVVAQKLAAQLASSSTPTYLVNTFEEQDVGKLVQSVIAGKLPAAKKPSEEAMTALRSKFDEFLKARFPDMPEDISPQ